MATSLNFKDIIDIPLWRPESDMIAANAAGQCMAWDNRNSDVNGLPYIYNLRSASALDFLDPTTGEWMPLASPALAGAFGAGACAVLHPSQGPKGTLAAGSTTSKIIISAALPAAVGVNQLANRGDGVGFRVAVIGNAAGSSGKIEYRTVVANTGGTTPTIWLDTPLSFTPATGDAYEFKSGRIFLLSAGLLASGAFKYYDILTNSYNSVALSITNLPATVGTDSSMIALAESYVSNDRKPGEGFVSGGGSYDVAGTSKNCIVATASSATTITGSGMPADLQANEYTNFQVRIVEDSTTPTAVGQRRRISSHTAGATGAFTVAAWAVTPSATAKFVVENDNDKLLARSTATASVYNYNIAANTWDTTTWAAGTAHGAGVILCQAYGITRDITNNARHSHIFCVRGGGVAAIDLLDIAAAATGTWAADIVYGNKGETYTTGTCGAYSPVTNSGRFLHINVNGTQRMRRFDVRNRIMDPGTTLRYSQGTAVVGGRLAIGTFIDGTTKLDHLYQVTASQVKAFSVQVPR